MSLRALHFTKAQFRELLRTLVIGNHVRAVAHEAKGKSTKDLEDLEDRFLASAGQFDSLDLVRRKDGALLPSDAFHESCHDELDAFEEDAFWDELARRLSERDFFESATPEDRTYIDTHDGEFPPRIDWHYQKYEHEFREHNTDRLRIVE